MKLGCGGQTGSAVSRAVAATRVPALVRQTRRARFVILAGLVMLMSIIGVGSPSVAAGPPTLSVSFSPNTTYGQQATTMTITIGDTNDGTPMSLTSNFNNTFPTQMVVASAPASTTCRNAADTASAVIQTNTGGTLAAGSLGIRLPSGSVIPAGGCTITVSVRGTSVAGTFTNTTSTLVTNKGTAPAASAPLTIAAGVFGRVYNDVNLDGTDNGEAGFANAYVVVRNDATGVCSVTQTDATGAYGLPVTSGASHTVYETYANPGAACPPTNFAQPPGMTMSTAVRTRTFTAAFTNTQSFGHAAPDSFTNNGECSNYAYQTVHLSNGLNLLQVNLLTGAVADLSTTSYWPTQTTGAFPSVNAMAMDDSTGILFAVTVAQTPTQVLAILNGSPQPTSISLGSVPGLPSNTLWSNGEIIDGYLYIQAANSTPRVVHVIDINPNRSTYLRLVEPANLNQLDVAPLGVTVTGGATSIDFALGDDGFLYGASNGLVRRLNPVTGVETSITPTGTAANLASFAAQSGFGAAYAATSVDFAGGYIFFGSNAAPGPIYRYNVTTNVIELVSQINQSTASNDGARCRMPLLLEGGDAPDSAPGTAGGATPDYRTTVSDDGPRHQLPANAATRVTLGTQIDGEENGQPNVAATGDDNTGTPDDEDGVSLSPLTAAATPGNTYSVTVTGSNTTSGAATVACWADWNRDGVFATAERIIGASVPGGAGGFTRNLAWTLPAGFAPVVGTNYYLRCRISTDTGATTGSANWAANPTPDGDGRALADGEIEDYRLVVTAALDVVKSVTTVNGNPATPATVVTPGAVIGYSIRLTNPAPSPVTTTLTETIGNNVTYTGTGEGWTCPTGTDPGDQCTRNVTVGGGSTTTVTFTVTVDNPLPAGVTSIGNAVTSSQGTCSACQVTNPAGTPALTLVKTASPSTYAAGDVVTYTFTTTNTGTTTLSGVRVSDTGLTGLSALSCTPAAPATLAPGAVLACTATKTMTQAEADAGAVTNTATATGTPPGGGPDVTDIDDETVTSSPAPALELVKSASPSTYGAGDVVTYTFTTTNTGTTTLSGVRVSDTGLTGLSALSCTPAAPTTLAPGEVLACTATKTMTQAEADAGAVTNTATATGTPPGGGPDVTDTDDETVTSSPTPALELVKSASPSTYGAGDVVRSEERRV
ncbi:beta strand repeat-containing protein, partial [Nocardioides sp.]|uniref:beta strand repeat-containing protein n=1 Tax=Nocardioides sp. TaxID=35761 RepID=UPI003D140868